MRSHITGEEITNLSLYVRKRDKDIYPDAKEFRFLIIRYNFPDLTQRDKLENLYLSKKYSLPDFKREFGLNFEQTQFLLNWFGINKRSHSESCLLGAAKAKDSCNKKYGVQNVSQIDSVKKKKSNTFIKNYGADNIWKTDEFKKGLDGFYLAKYGMTFINFQRKRSKKVWENKTEKEKAEWLEKSILSESSMFSAKESKVGQNISKPEGRISNLLSLMKIPHIRQFAIKDGKRTIRYDFLLLELNLVIEFNGDFWHANPEIFKKEDIIKFKTTEKRVSDIWERDLYKKNKAIDYGCSYLVIWEREVKSISDEDLVILLKHKINQSIIK